MNDDKVKQIYAAAAALANALEGASVAECAAARRGLSENNVQLRAAEQFCWRLQEPKPRVTLRDGVYRGQAGVFVRAERMSIFVRTREQAEELRGVLKRDHTHDEVSAVISGEAQESIG